MRRIGLMTLVSSCLLICRSNAELREAIITWKGDAGYRARITMDYDDAFASVGAWGGGAFGGTATNQGIAQLSVAFFNPSLQPVFSTNDISNGNVTYRFLNISFDTTTRSVFGFLDVGKDSFAEGEPGSSAGQYYLTGVSLPTLHDSSLGQAVDSGGQFVVTIVPEPSCASLGVTAMILVTLIFRLKANRGSLRGV